MRPSRSLSSRILSFNLLHLNEKKVKNIDKTYRNVKDLQCEIKDTKYESGYKLNAAISAGEYCRLICLIQMKRPLHHDFKHHTEVYFNLLWTFLA